VLICIVCNDDSLFILFIPSESNVSSSSLLSLDGFEKSLEVTGTETIVVASLDDLHEEGGSVFKRQGEDL
jgi:hypothetical protein